MEEKKDVKEYINLTLMNLNKQIEVLNDRLEKINWNLGQIAKNTKKE